MIYPKVQDILAAQGRPARRAALDQRGRQREGWDVVLKRPKKGGIFMPDSIVAILEAMRTSHQGHLEKLLAWKAAGGTLPVYPNCESIDDFINRERLAVSRFTMSIEHLREYDAALVK
jgi:hypothetical protein